MEILSKVQNIFGQVFKVDPQSINIDTTAANFKSWDSLHHMELIIALQNGLGIKFKMTELASLTSVKTIVEVAQKKIVAA